MDTTDNEKWIKGRSAVIAIKRAQRSEYAFSVLLKETTDMLVWRPATHSIEDIGADTGIDPHWIHGICNGAITPSMPDTERIKVIRGYMCGVYKAWLPFVEGFSGDTKGI